MAVYRAPGRRLSSWKSVSGPPPVQVPAEAPASLLPSLAPVPSCPTRTGPGAERPAPPPLFLPGTHIGPTSPFLVPHVERPVLFLLTLATHRPVQRPLPQQRPLTHPPVGSSPSWCHGATTILQAPKYPRRALPLPLRGPCSWPMAGRGLCLGREVSRGRSGRSGEEGWGLDHLLPLSASRPSGLRG